MSQLTVWRSLPLIGFLALTACEEERKAKEACEDYHAEVGGSCPATEAGEPTCDEAKAKDLDRYECLLAWAQDGCSGTPAC